MGEIPAKCAAQSGSVLLIILLGIVTSVLPYLLYTYGLTGISASKAAIFASVEPVVAMLLGLLFFGEPLTLSAVAGMALVLGAVVLLSCEGKSSKAKGNG